MEKYKEKTVLVCSDTHGRTEKLGQVLKSMKFDALVFLGDGEGLENCVSCIPGCPAELYFVKGNNDYGCGLKESAVAEFGRHRIFLTHGHRYRIYHGSGLLYEAAQEQYCDYCFFGHLHRPLLYETDGVTFLNPGSLEEPRQHPQVPTCAVLRAGADGDLSIEFINALSMKRLNFLNF